MPLPGGTRQPALNRPCYPARRPGILRTCATAAGTIAESIVQFVREGNSESPFSKQIFLTAFLVDAVDLLLVLGKVLPQDVFRIGGDGHSFASDLPDDLQNLLLGGSADVDGAPSPNGERRHEDSLKLGRGLWLVGIFLIGIGNPGFSLRSPEIPNLDGKSDSEENNRKYEIRWVVKHGSKVFRLNNGLLVAGFVDPVDFVPEGGDMVAQDIVHERGGCKTFVANLFDNLQNLEFGGTTHIEGGS